MRIKKLIAALTSTCLTATSLLSAVSLQTSAAENDNTMIFDIRSNGQNAVEISGESIKAGDMAVPVQIYIPKNPGFSMVGLKFQVNDGQIAADGSFGNYGFYLSDGDFASPYCIDSVNEGDASQAMQASFNYESMNIIWVNGTIDLSSVDAYAEPNTIAWDNPSWAYDYAFAECTLMVPKDTPAGVYSFDIRREKYLNSVSLDSNTEVYGCTSIVDENGEVLYDTIPLTITVGSVADTTTSTTTTTSSSVTTTTTTSTTPAPVVDSTTTTSSTAQTTTTTSSTGTTEPVWQDSPKVLDECFYWNINDVAGKAGETVTVDVFVYGDPGTAGVSAWFGYDQALEMTAMNRGKAYKSSPTVNPECYPACLAFANTQGGTVCADDGKVVVSLEFKIPSNATAGTVYPVYIYQKYDDETETEVVDKDGKALPVKFIAGSVTVLEGNETALNYTQYNFTEAGEVLDLTLFNAPDDVQWSTSDESVVTVNDKGLVTCVSVGDAVITATVGDKQYICRISGGFYGDVDGNGTVDTIDATMILFQFAKSMFGTDYLDESQKARADVDGNGMINEVDATMVLRYYTSNEILHKELTWYDLTGNPNAPGAPV